MALITATAEPVRIDKLTERAIRQRIENYELQDRLNELTDMVTVMLDAYGRNQADFHESIERLRKMVE